MISFNLYDYFYSIPFIQDMLNSLEESVYIVDKEGCFVFINTAVEKFEGLKNEKVCKKHLNEIYEQDYSPTLDAIKSGRAVKQFENRYIIKGKEFCQLAMAMPLYHHGEIVGGYSIHKDITSIEAMTHENIKLQKQTADCKEQKDFLQFSDLIGKSPEFLQCVQMAKSAAQSDSSVLLTGSTGSGKEVFAKCIHNHSSRAKKPFVAINCAAIPETLLESILFGTSRGSFTGAIEKKGLFEQADGGTLFLDEINSMPLSAQVKLLRVLEEKEVRPLGSASDIKTDVRIISCSNISPQEAIKKNQIREDLFYRLSVVNIAIPSLKERKEDILLLVDYFLKLYNRKLNKSVIGLSNNAVQFFMNYPWPGNVRQLRHAIESAMNFVSPNEKLISLEKIPHYLFQEKKDVIMSSFNPSMENARSSYIPDNNHAELNTQNIFSAIEETAKKQILDALFETRGNVSKAAQNLGIHRQSLIYRMKKYNIKRK